MKEATKTIELGVQLMKCGRFEQAEHLCRHVLNSHGNHPDALHLMGLISHRTGKFHDAIHFISKAIEKRPRMAVFYYNLGLILAASGELGKAKEVYREAIFLKPDYTEAINNLGLILYDEDKIEESIILFQQAIRNNPDFSNAYYNLGNALQAWGHPQAAIEAYDRVLKMLPDSAETRFNRSLSLLLTGNFKEGWDEYEWRFKNLNSPIKNGDQKGLQRWDGASFVGKRLLVLDEQGIGDTFQFVRYLPMVKELGGTVIFETIESLINLFGNFYSIDELRNRRYLERSELEFDFYIPLMSLPGIFKTTLETIPAKVPYIFPDTTRVQYWRQQLNKGGIKVGIVWAGKTTAEYRRARMSGLEHVHLGWAGQPASKFASKRLARLEYFTALTKIEGIQLYGLQKGNAADQARTLSGSVNVINLCEESTDFSDVAAAMVNLDLIISVDTALAHLAGAMGKPVWVLIPFVSDWRWLLERESSPWYPTMRLFRQRKRGDWEDVFRRIFDELKALVHQ